jgi:uncharacterized glyoxalase superfamily protein PhnB
MTQVVYPAVRYRDSGAALEWLERAFGAEEDVVYRDDEGRVRHAVIRIAGGLVMFGQHDDDGWLGGERPRALASTVSIYIVVPDPDQHYARTRAAGATIVRELEDQPYGSREYSARDLEGNLWSFGTYDPAAR